MRNPFRRRNGMGGEPPYIPPAPTINWKPFYEINERRKAKGYEPIPPDVWEETIREMLRPKPVERKYTRKEVEHLQNMFYKRGQPLSAAEIFELMGVDTMSIKEQLDSIEAQFAASVAEGEARLDELKRWGITIPEDAHAKMTAEKKAARDAAIPPVREAFFAMADQVRGTHNALRWEARTLATPSVSAETRERMEQLLKGCRNRRDVERLHSEALATGDESSAYWLEQHGAEVLNDFDAMMWKGVGERERDRRASEPLRRIKEDEDALRAGLDILNSHPTFGEHEATAAALNVPAEHLPMTSAGLQLPAPDPVF